MNNWQAAEFLAGGNDMPQLFGLREPSGDGYTPPPSDDYPLTTLVSNQYYTWRFYKKNGIVTVFGKWTGNTGSWFSENHATLPADCRPPMELWFPPIRDNSGSSYTGDCAAIVSTGGIIGVSNRGGAQANSQRTWTFSFGVA